MEIVSMEIEEIKPAQGNTDPVIDEMTKAGLQFGHKTSKTYPTMKEYVAGVRNGIHVFNLEKTKEKLDQALLFIADLAKNGKTILLVGTKIQLKGMVEQTAEECGLPFISQRWIGGTFTNFDTISKRIAEMLDLEKKKETGELEKYTKKEQLKIAEQIAELEKKYGGLRNMTKLPDAVFVCDVDQNHLVVREAKKKKIPVVAICDTNIDPADIDHFIPANDDAASSVHYILEKVKQTILNAKNA